MAGHKNSAEGRVGLNLLHQFSCKVYSRSRAVTQSDQRGKNAEEILCAFPSATSVPSLRDSRTVVLPN